MSAYAQAGAAAPPGEWQSALVGIGQALRRLRPAVSLAGLLRQATTAVCDSVGFERAVLFSLQGHALVATSVYTSGAPELSDGLLAKLRSESFELDPGLYESEVLRRRTPILVRDATDDPRALGTLPGSPSYVAAPLVCQQRVVGLVEADRELTGRQMTELDRDTLAAFAEGFGYALERNLLAERLRAQSARVVALARSTEIGLTQLNGPELELSQRGEGVSDSPADPLGDELTRRELEVLAMLADGETNASIAQRLVVSEGTVKTHVKHILRKLGVQNRAQAVSRYYRARAPREEQRSTGRVHALEA